MRDISLKKVFIIIVLPVLLIATLIVGLIYYINKPSTKEIETTILSEPPQAPNSFLHQAKEGSYVPYQTNTELPYSFYLDDYNIDVPEGKYYESTYGIYAQLDEHRYLYVVGYDPSMANGLDLAMNDLPPYILPTYSRKSSFSNFVSEQLGFLNGSDTRFLYTQVLLSEGKTNNAFLGVSYDVLLQDNYSVFILMLTNDTESIYDCQNDTYLMGLSLRLTPEAAALRAEIEAQRQQEREELFEENIDEEITEKVERGEPKDTSILSFTCSVANQPLTVKAITKNHSTEVEVLLTAPDGYTYALSGEGNGVYNITVTSVEGEYIITTTHFDAAAKVNVDVHIGGSQEGTLQ